MLKKWSEMYTCQKKWSPIRFDWIKVNSSGKWHQVLLISSLTMISILCTVPHFKIMHWKRFLMSRSPVYHMIIYIKCSYLKQDRIIIDKVGVWVCVMCTLYAIVLYIYACMYIYLFFSILCASTMHNWRASNS